MSPIRFTVSIVCYFSDLHLLGRTLRSLDQELRKIPNVTGRVVLVDNGSSPLEALLAQCELCVPVEVLRGQGNIGFGRGHNLALQRADGEFFLVLNPDIEFMEGAVGAAISFLASHREVGCVVPAVVDGGGEQAHLCRAMPTVFDLALRGFAPEWLKLRFRQRLNSYELVEYANEPVLWDPPLVSGCCMFFRAGILRSVGGFDPSYFLYFEDYDLSLRCAKIARVARLNASLAVHYGGNSAKKGWRHRWYFLKSAVLFFRSYGWRWL